MTEVKQVNIYKPMIQIKRNNKVFFTLEDFGEGSKLSYQLMDHHYVILKFTTATPIYFEIGDSVEIPDFGYFELTSSYFPKHNDSDGYDYEMQMDAYYMSWKNKLCKYRPQHGANETSFKLTTTVGVHMNVILGNLKALGLTYNGKEFSVDYTTYNNKAFDVQKRFLIEYGSISILDALNAICSEDALNCEWWIDGSIIYLGYCEMEGQTTFEQDVNVLSMSYSESKSTYITRLYAFGSDRNIPKGYFTGADADVTTDGVATDYLMLPNKKVDSDGFYAKDGYLENVNVVKNDKQAIEGVVMFDEEYPKVECRVSRIKTYDSTVDNDDGTKTTQTFWQVGSMDSFAESFEASWIKSNLTLGIKFTSGALMGMEFDVSFKIIDKENFFEIVANDTYGRTLPDSLMCPKEGDRFFLFNWDATKITDTDLIPTAQLSLFDRAKQYYQKTMISNSNFTCTMDGDKFYNDGTYDYHPLGEQVKLINDMFAQVDADGKHYRNSRIIGMEIPLDIPYDHPQYTVGEKAATSRLGKLEDKVDSIKVNGMQIGGTGSGNGGGVYVIGMNDTTPASDSNVYSARRSRMEFVSRLLDNTAKGTITWEKVQKFLQGLTAENLSQFKKGATFGEFIQGMLFGTGGRIDELGNAEFESITSRSSIIAKELITNRQTAMESNFVFTESGLVETVAEIPATTEDGNVTYDLKLQKRWDNDFTAFKENDVVLASINTLAENGKYYDMWLRVLSVNTVTNTITVVCYPDNECPSKKNYPPCELARLIRWGNAVDEDRQSCWYISSSEGLLVWLDHVTKPIIDKTNYSLAMGKLPDALSFLFQDFPTANKRDGAFYAKWMMAASFQQIDYQGNPIYTTRDRGVWSLAVAQGDNPYRNGDRTIDTVYYLGCKWQCLEDKTIKPPIYSSTAWAFVEGNPYFTLEMQSSKLWNFRLNDLMATNADGSWKVFTTLSVVGRLYNQDVTDSMVNVVWTRDSGNPTADNKWALSHANCGLSVDLTYEDLGGAAFKIGSVTFRCDAEIKDGETMYSEDVSVSF